MNNIVEVGYTTICQDAETHAKSLRYIDSLFVECIDLAVACKDFSELEEPLHWRLRKAREKLKAATSALAGVYMVGQDKE